MSVNLRHRISSADSPHTRSGATSGSSSLGLSDASHGAMPWSRAVQLCRDSDLSVGGIVMQAASNGADDASEVTFLTGASPRELEFLGVCVDIALTRQPAPSSSAKSASGVSARRPAIAEQLGHIAHVFADRYDDVVASNPLHKSFVAALCACNNTAATGPTDQSSLSPSDHGSDDATATATVTSTAPHDVLAAASSTSASLCGPCVDVTRIARGITKGVRNTFPGADPRAAGSQSWFRNHTALLLVLYNTARELVFPTTSASPVGPNDEAENTPRLSGGAHAVTSALAVLETSTDLINQHLSHEQLPNLIRNPAFLECLARVLSMSSVVDASTLPEGLTASLNECFTKCTKGIDALLSHRNGLPVVRAVLDDLARGVKARRYVMDHVVPLSLDVVAKHAVIAFLDHTAKVSSRVGTEALQAAPAALLDRARECAPGLADGTPALVAMACHIEASHVVPYLLRYADGYHAVAFSDALNTHKDIIGDAAASLEGATFAAEWARTNPNFDDAVIAAHTRLGRDLVFARKAIAMTAGLKSIDAAIAARGASRSSPLPPHKVTGRVCFPFADTGSCAAGSKCTLLHVDGAVVAALCDRDCCCEHGSEAFIVANEAPMALVAARASLQVIDATDHSRSVTIAPSQLSFTAGLAVYVARDLNIGLPIESDALCRQHSRCSCQKPQQCKYIHACRQVYAAVAEWTAPPPKASTAAVDSTSAAAAQPATVVANGDAAAALAATPKAAVEGGRRQPRSAIAAAVGEGAPAPVAGSRRKAQPAGDAATARNELPPPLARRPLAAATAAGSAPASMPHRGTHSEASSASELAPRSRPAAATTGETPPLRSRVRHSPYAVTPSAGAGGHAGFSAFEQRSPSVASTATAASHATGHSRPFITHVSADPMSGSASASPVAPPPAGGPAPRFSGNLKPLHSSGRFTDPSTPDMRGHQRQFSEFTNGSQGHYSNVSESPLAMAMGNGRARSRRPSDSGGGCVGAGNSVASGVSQGAQTAGSEYPPQQNAYGAGFSFGPGHSTPNRGYSGGGTSTTPTTNRTTSV